MALGPLDEDMSEAAIKPELIKKRIWLDYQYACSNPVCERLDSVHALIAKLADTKVDMHGFLQETADALTSKIGVKEATIGLRTPSDGLYRYEVMSGLSDTEWAAHKNLSYRKEDFYNQEIYKFTEISKYTRLLLAEDNPYASGEEATYEREVMLQSKRKSLEDTIEGDYMDICIFGKGDDLLGWIEISGMQNGRFPDTETIKCLELLASIIGAALVRFVPESLGR